MPRTLSSTEYTELGKRYYRSKEYQKALDAFTEAIEASTSPNVTLFDYRAATWEKLDDLPAALAEGRRMIKAGKTDARGYLRTALVLQKMKKPEVALGIYEYGLRNIPVSTSPHLKLLQDAHDKLNRQLSPPAAVDPLSVLPVELVEMVVGYLRFYEIINCLRVSKEWKSFITSAPSLWSNLDLFRKNQQKYAKSQSIRSCIKYSQYKIHTARLHRFSDRSSLRTLVTTCKNLANLELLQTDFGGDSIIETVMIAKSLKTLKLSAAVELDLDQITQILKHRPTLATIQVDHLKEPRIASNWSVDLPGLEILNLFVIRGQNNHPYLDSRPLLPNLNLPELIQRAPNLKELHLTGFKGQPAPVFDFTSLRNLQVLRMLNCPLQAPPILPPSIRELGLLQVTNHYTAFRGFQFQSNLPNLEKLQLSGLEFDFPEACRLLDGFDDGSEAEIVGQPRKLTWLGLTGCYTGLWPDASLELQQILSHPRVSDIEELVLTVQTDFTIDDFAAEIVANQFKNLRRLDLSATWVTGVGVKAIATALKPHLKWLDLSYCRHLSVDAVEWARKEGIEVVYRREPDAKGGKDLRRVLYRD